MATVALMGRALYQAGQGISQSFVGLTDTARSLNTLVQRAVVEPYQAVSDVWHGRPLRGSLSIFLRPAPTP